MERADAWGTRAREVAGYDARDGADGFGCGEQVCLEVDHPGRDAAYDDVGSGEGGGELLDAVGEVSDADPYALRLEFLRRGFGD